MSRTTITTQNNRGVKDMSDVIQLTLSQEDKERLRCIHCMRYISSPPIRILPNGCNVCAHCYISPAVVTYRNKTLEAILRNVVFPCAFHLNGCFETLPFSQAADHERTCPFKHHSAVVDVLNPAMTNPLPVNAVDPLEMEVIEVFDDEPSVETKNSPQATCSASHSENNQGLENNKHSVNNEHMEDDQHSVNNEHMEDNQHLENNPHSESNQHLENNQHLESNQHLENNQHSESNRHLKDSQNSENNHPQGKPIPTVVKSSNSVCEQAHLSGMDPKFETASTSQAESVCSDATSAINDGSRMNDRASTNNSQSSNMNRPRSALNNRPRNNWYYGRGNYTPYGGNHTPYGGNQPYHLDWRYDNNMYNRQNQFRPEHVMFKRRNNVIIIKGGTFYVNW